MGKNISKFKKDTLEELKTVFYYFNMIFYCQYYPLFLRIMSLSVNVNSSTKYRLVFSGGLEFQFPPAKDLCLHDISDLAPAFCLICFVIISNT